MNRAASLDLRSVSRLFRALGDETRLRIVALLSHGELCVCHLQQALDLSQPHISRHLGILRAAGVVDARRQGSWMHYRLRTHDEAECDVQLRALIESFGNRDVLRRDVKRVRASCGPGACP